jgi:hypothetical protein
MRTQSHAIKLPSGHEILRLRAGLDECIGILRRLFDPYRPERHYMRGPGPKWFAKHRARINAA